MSRNQVNTPVNTLAEQLKTACLLEATARKVGNVHPGAAFTDLTYQDFCISAEIIGETISRTPHIGVGQAILSAVQETRARTGTNVNLGMVLLLAPLAAVPQQVKLADGIEDILKGIHLSQTELIYEAIQIAQAGGMGQVEAEDVSQHPTMPILQAMQLAADRDLIAQQYINNYQEVLKIGREFFLRWVSRNTDWELAVISLQLELMSLSPDSLIARKCGYEIAQESQNRAKEILDANWPVKEEAWSQLKEFDFWLRSDDHCRNPGTTADLIAAILFTVIRDGDWHPPSSIAASAKSLFDEFIRSGN